MAGLPTKSNAPAAGSSHAMQQLYRLFESRGGEQSTHAHAHWQQVLRLGFPHAKLEDWKYTPVSSLLGNQFFAPQQQALTVEQIKSLALPLDCYRLVFIDGRFDADLSDSDTGAFEIEKLSPAAQQTLPDPIQSEVFLHLTESLAQDSLSVRLPAGKQAEKPLYLLHLSSGRDQSREMNTVHHRYHLSIEGGANAEVIEHYLSLNDHGHFTGARMTVNVGDNADFTHYKLAFESQASFHFSHNDLVIGRDARVASHSFLLGAGLTRNNTSAQLNGENSNLNINSLVLPVDSEIADTRTYLEHNKGYCNSNQLHKVIVNDRAKAIFNGMIKVAQHALKTDGKMTNNNLLLGKHTEVDTKPQLEIYADDVKCSHGATVGRIDDEQLFYLRTRGISGQDAQQMIIFAFAAELTEAIENETLREVVIARIAGRLNRGK
ncbi:Fe-S cluster assembly protein SufD [Rahnella bonaserana]|uniref:Fe-S cluster assembly protein SufD n=1 Tax=Rahnella bonaserana TaxID=2816248 RepID=A0ABS6LTT6_9GAMM|nr:Fe-S cluster assembly protein SufD [Rahnella bonaserana]MBU9855507.1 Fe-S cluster assembly protein SufD [Rahnella bonaserana]MCL9640950.1 Fe-S cluster assembly protein SufD [Rahnella victoriana]WHZ39195.1 Fe-S cluster assembly protein SufD [Rahnella bonaserana]